MTQSNMNIIQKDYIKFSVWFRREDIKGRKKTASVLQRCGFLTYQMS